MFFWLKNRLVDWEIYFSIIKTKSKLKKAMEKPEPNRTRTGPQANWTEPNQTDWILELASDEREVFYGGRGNARGASEEQALAFFLLGGAADVRLYEKSKFST